MERRKIIHPNQQITDGDLNDMGEFARTSLDHVVHDCVEPGLKYWGFPVTETGPLEVTVGEGRLIWNGAVYYRNDDGGVVISLADYVPAVTRKIVTIAVWGNQFNTAVQPRTFLVDSETGQTEAEAVATESRRWAEVNAVPGAENANPQPPALGANVLAVAHVLMGPSGIISITPVDDNRVRSVAENAAGIKDLQTWRLRAGTILDTLGTNISGLSERVRTTVKRRDLLEMMRDIARVKYALAFDSSASSYATDYFWSEDDSDTEHADYNSKVFRGLGFPHAAEKTANLALLNPLEDRVKVTSNFALPTYTPVPRISVVGRDGDIPISQYQHQTVETTQKTMTRLRMQYTDIYDRNVPMELRLINYDQALGVYKFNGESWVIEGDIRYSNYGDYFHYADFRQVKFDYVEEPYWDVVTTSESVSGSVLGQTFLNSQDGWMTHVDLYFTQVAASGNVHVLLTETTNGAPDLSKVIASVTVNQSDIKTYPTATRVPFTPTYLKKDRYAIVLITQGAHLVAYVQDNKFAEGTLFYSTDGAWFQGDLARDLAMQVHFARFNVTRVEVQIEPFELSGGIGAIDILATAFVPDGCKIVFEIQINGVWRAIQGHETNILSSLPPLVPARIVFLGTTDLMPGITFGSASRVTTYRLDDEMVHVSKVRDPAGSVDTVEVRTRLVGFDDTKHSLDCVLLKGAGYSTEVAADSYEDRETGHPEQIERIFYFDLDPTVDSYKIKLEGETTDAQTTFYVYERTDVSYAS